MTYLRSSLPRLLEGEPLSTLAPPPSYYLAGLSNPNSNPASPILLLIISLSALLILLSTIITLLIWIRLLVGVILCITVVLVVLIGGRDSAAAGGIGVSFDIVVVLVKKGMNAATAGVISVVLGMDDNNVSSDVIMRRPSRSALKRFR